MPPFTDSKIYILYENPDWMKPLVRELKKAKLPFEEWFFHHGCIALQEPPPSGIFLNRISPSSHTRGHAESIFFNREVLAWLESHDRRVINGSKAYALEVSKVRQYTALEKAGIKTPKTLAICGGPEELKKAVRKMSLPFLTKHNCGGKGLGIKLFQSYEAFEQLLETFSQDLPIDHLLLLQEYIEPAQKRITRVEIVDGQFLYAINSDTSRGFELCPAESCNIGTAFCPTDRQSLFSLRKNFKDPIIQQYINFMKKHEIDIAGFEFIENKAGIKITYDINCTTNYSPSVEKTHSLNGMQAIASFLGRELKKSVVRPTGRF